MNIQSPIHKSFLLTGILILLLCYANYTNASDKANNEFLGQIQVAWTQAKYQETGDTQLEQFEALIDKVAHHQALGHPEVQLWYAMSLSSYAQLKGGLSGLKFAKKAKNILEGTIKETPNVGNGLGQSVLGALYARVPGWPVGFGDKHKARKYLLTGYAIDKNSIDTNYYLGDFLLSQQEYELANKHLTTAMRQKHSDYGQVYLSGRQQEISDLIHILPASYK